MSTHFMMVAILLLAVALFANGEDISLKKVHLVESRYKNAAMFRGNAPLTQTTTTSSSSGKGEATVFAYDTLMSYIRTRAQQGNISNYPANNSKVYLVDITFENIFDKGFDYEADFWANGKNADKGRYLQWLLVGAPIWATAYSTKEQDEKIKSGSIWDVDKIPKRLGEMVNMLKAGPPAGYDFLSVYVHCAGGCDRTGEFVTNYRIQYQHAPLLTTLYTTDIGECGRAPNYFATGAIGWYCLQWNLFNNASSPMPDCLTAYKCELFKSCKGTGV